MLTVLALGGVATIAVSDFRKGESTILEWVVVLIGIVYFPISLALCASWIWSRYAEEYVLTGAEFVIEHGWMRTRVPWTVVSELKPDKSPRHAAIEPAYRILVATPINGNNVVEVSPTNVGRFLNEVTARCPHLVRDGDRLVSKPPGAPGV